MYRTYNVLLIDDDEGDQLLLSRIFSKLENIVLKVLDNGKVALDFLNEQLAKNNKLPNLILVDLNMPIIDGKSFLSKIKNLPDLKYIPTVVLSTSDFERDIDESYRLGANGYVVKPLDYNKLQEDITTMTRYWLTVNVVSKR